MQLATIDREVSSHGLLEVHRASLLASAKVFDMFENHYSDKFRAIVRELVANAIDAHRAAGQTKPVQVYLPDDLDPYFRVKDIGLGMSHEFTTTNFMQYSNGSTKNNGNADIGGFGIGSKSPFAYTDQFTLTVCHEGTKSVYSMFKDETGFPSIGLLEQTSTSEPNGVEFFVPVEPRDFDDFGYAAQKHLPYFGDEVLLFGAEMDSLNYVQTGTNWSVRRRTTGYDLPQVVMGGMSYPISVDKLSWDDRHDSQIEALMRMPIDLKLPIGACSIAPNRETLIYDDKTKTAIPDAFRKIVHEVTADMPTMFDHLDTQWEACKALSEYLGGDRTSPHSRLVMNHVKWRGNDLETYYRPTRAGWDALWEIEPRVPSGRYRRRRTRTDCPPPSWQDRPLGLSPGDIQHIIINDLESKDAPIKRIRTFVDDTLEQADRVLVIRAQDVPTALASFGNPENVTLASSLPEIAKVARDKVSKAERAKVRMFRVQEYQMDDGQTRVSPRSWRSPVKEIAFADQPDSGILLVCDNFLIPSAFFTAKRNSMITFDEVYLVNKSDAGKLGDGWQPWEELVQQRIETQLAAFPTASEWKALRSSDLHDLITFLSANPRLAEQVPKTKPLNKLVELIEAYKSDFPANLNTYVEAKLPPRINPGVLLERIKTAHPNFVTLFDHLRCSSLDNHDDLFKLYKDNF